MNQSAFARKKQRLNRETLERGIGTQSKEREADDKHNVVLTRLSQS